MTTRSYPDRGAGRPGQRRGPPSGPRPEGSPGIPGGYLSGGYFDEGGNLKVEVVGDWAKAIASALIGPNPRQPRMKSARLRNFYTKSKQIERKLDAGESFESLRAEIASLERDAAGAVGRGNAPNEFKSIMDANVKEALQSEAAFRQGFLEHFQSIVAFHKYQESSAGRPSGR